jgi:predicted Zn finger-like uncharacterized protein
MQTTCPECRTTFRVSQDHLGARRGLVRCGHCNAVFNAYDTLLPELESPPADAVSERSDQSPETGLSAVVQLAGAGPQAGERQAEETGDVRPEPVKAAAFDALQANDAAGQVHSTSAQAAVGESGAVIQPVSAASQETQPDILLQPLWEEPAKQQRSLKFVRNLFLAVLLAGLLLLQVAYFLRADLAAALPFTRPALESLCQPLQCDVPLSRQLTQAAIAASSLEHDPENKSRVRLTFLLTNRSGQTQAWPQITLTLSDVRQAPVAQQVFQPQTYLPKGVKTAAGMPAGAEREIRLDLDIGNLVASGYALSLSYP